jgi:hypothetical protein
MTDEYLLEHGYKEYQPTAYDDDYIVGRFQKRFDDDIGKKYFINAIKYSQEYIPECRRDRFWEPFIYEYEVHITMNKNEDPLILHFLSSWNTEEIEEFMESFFERMNPNYYETWEES